MLADSFGRIATDLRVSLTDRCNLRCTYWMPPEGLDWLSRDEVLSDDEVVRLVGIGVRRAVAVKKSGHGINDPAFLQPERPMPAIGG